MASSSSDIATSVALQLRKTFETSNGSGARQAFKAFLGRTIAERLEELSALLPSLNINDSTVSNELFSSYLVGMRDGAADPQGTTEKGACMFLLMLYVLPISLFPFSF